MKKIEELIDKLVFIIGERSSQFIPVHILGFEEPSLLKILPLNDDIFRNREVLEFNIETEYEISLNGERYYLYDKDELELRMREIDDEKLLTDKLSCFPNFKNQNCFNCKVEFNVGDEIAYVIIDRSTGKLLSKIVRLLILDIANEENNFRSINTCPYWIRAIKRKYIVNDYGGINESGNTIEAIIKLRKYGNN